MCSVVYFMNTHVSLLIIAACNLLGYKAECFDSLRKQWLFDIPIKRSPTSTRYWVRQDIQKRAQSKVFSNRIRLKVIFLVEWISNCVCLHTLAGRWSLAENTIMLEICVGLLTRWQNLTESKYGRRPGREARDGKTRKIGREGQVSPCISTF